MSILLNIKRAMHNSALDTAFAIIDKIHVFLSVKQLYSKLITFNFTEEDLSLNIKCIKDGNKFNGKTKTVMWFIPAFNQKFAGISTIFKLASYLSSQKIKQYFVILGDTEFANKNRLDILKGAYGLELKMTEVSINPEIKSLPHVDVSIATRWDTAYYSLKFNSTYKKLYLIQDDERLFYPAGEIRSLVEETYRFGFTGITNSMSLKEMYKNEFNGKCFYFFQPLDETFSNFRMRNKSSISKIWFYSRKRAKRNGFALGMLGLREIKRRHPEIEVYFAGDNSHKPKYFVYKDLGYLSMDKYKSLLDECDVGLYFIFSNHPGIIPFENMAHGCITLTNRRSKNPELKDLYNCVMCNSTPSGIADAFDKVFNNKELRKLLISNGFKTINSKIKYDYTKVMHKVL